MVNYMTPNHDPNEESSSGNFIVPPMPTSSNPTPQPAPAPKPITTPVTPSTPPTPPTTPITPPPEGPNSNAGGGKKFAWIHSLAFKIVAGVIVILIVALLIFGYMVLAKGKTAVGEKVEDAIWQAIIDDSNQDQSDLEATITYSDKGSFSFVPSKFFGSLPVESQVISPEEATKYDKDYSFSLKDLLVSTTLKTYIDLSNSNVPKADMHIDGMLTNNSKSFDGSLDIRVKESEAFIKFAYGDTMKEFIDKLSENTAKHEVNGKWFKSTGTFFEDLREGLGETKTNNKYKDLLKANRAFDIESLKGVSIMNGKPVVHYSLTINKEKVRNTINGIIEDTSENENKALRDALTKIFDAAIEKVEVKKYEVWIGVTDKKLYKSSIEINAISLANSLDYFTKVVSDPNHMVHKLIKDEVRGSKINSKDTKRVADMRQMAIALELYFNDYNSYPEAQNGHPIGISPYYIASLPTAPVPPDGECDEFLNTYWYKRPTANTYTYAFCLGSDIGGLGAGRNVVSESGIYSDKPAKQVRTDIQRNNGKEIYDKIAIIVTTIINDLNYDATIKIDLTAHTYGQVREIETPSDAEDLHDNYDNRATVY